GSHTLHGRHARARTRAPSGLRVLDGPDDNFGAKGDGMALRPDVPEDKIRRRAGSRALRKALLGVVYELVSEHGIEGTGIRAVAEAAQVSPGTINYHFGNKQNLLIQAYEDAYTLPDDWEQYKGSPTAQLKRLVNG